MKKKPVTASFLFCIGHRVLPKQGKEILSPIDTRRSTIGRETHHMPQDYGRKISSGRSAIPK